MTVLLPHEQLARAIVAKELGWQAERVQRFNTGLDFFVFDVSGSTGNVVVRVGRPAKAAVLTQGVALRARLRDLGVPVPETLAAGHAEGFPYIIQPRLPGSDLGNLMHALDTPSLTGIAEAVAAAQKATAQLGEAHRYGYAATAESAPHDRWTDVVAGHIARSEQRLAGTGLFPDAVFDQTRSLFLRHEEALVRVPATPFLHDTTTKNVIVTPQGGFSGIVDVDDLCFGDPRYAPALTEVAMLVHGGPLDYVRTWMALAGHRRDSVFQFYVTVFLLDFMSEHGTTFNGNEAASRPEDRARLMALFNQSLPG